jgi:NAD(P)-dependent dehydrogenase (short-subunit alcohol dehydrogenase family)
VNITVIGGSGGIGQAFVRQLVTSPDIQRIDATFLHNEPEISHPKVTWHPLDITDESAVQTWSEQSVDIDWLINAAGILHTPEQGPEKTIRHLDPGFFIDNMRINALPSLLLAKHLEMKFKHGRPAIFAAVSARVGSIEDNRLGGWVSYRSSKAALNMCLKTLAIEWGRTLPNVTVAALHPGTTDTALSKPFQRHMPEGQLFSPDRSVRYMLSVLERLQPDDTGQFRAFDGELLPW